MTMNKIETAITNTENRIQFIDQAIIKLIVTKDTLKDQLKMLETLREDKSYTNGGG